MTSLLLDAAPTGGIIGAVGGAVLFFIMAGAAAFSYFFLKRSVKMAVRLAIVAVLLIGALAGGLLLLYLGSTSERPRPGPPASRTR